MLFISTPEEKNSTRMSSSETRNEGMVVAQRFKKPAISLNHSELNSIHPETKEATHIINSGLLPIKKVTFMGEIQGWEGS